MPRGWYLAQGLIPLGEDSSDDDQGPCELPNGRIVCGPHGLVRCGKCCMDFSFMDEILDEEIPDLKGEEDDDADFDEAMLGPQLRKGTGRVFPSTFVPPSPSVAPLELFSGRKTHIMVKRYTLPDDLGKFLIRTDGSCRNNGQANPKAGWAFWHGEGLTGDHLVASGVLEQKGPFDDDGLQTSNRAELRAVIAALRFRHWPGEGFHTCVVATDSEYVVKGATVSARQWVRTGWKTSRGTNVANRDMWEVLLGEVERWKEKGMAVEFWRVPREWNIVADSAARLAVSTDRTAPPRWMEVIGLAIG